MATDVILVATKKAHNDWGYSKAVDKLINHRDYLSNNWGSGIENGNSDYHMSASKSGAVEVELDSPSDTSEALGQARDYLYNQTGLFDTYDGVGVLDSRTFSDAIGRAYYKEAGDLWPTAYTAGDGGKATTAHEIGHLYGGAHGYQDNPTTFESTELHHSIMGSYGLEDCNNSTSYTTQGHWYSQCTQNAIRSYMDSNGLS